MTGAKKPDRRADAEVSRKPLRGECRVFPGVTWLTRVRSTTTIAHAAIGRIGRPAFPAPSLFRGREVPANLAQNTRRDREAVSEHGRLFENVKWERSPGDPIRRPGERRDP